MRTSLRRLAIGVLLAGILSGVPPAAAGPGDWTALEHDGACTLPPAVATPVGNARLLRVAVGPLMGFATAMAATDTVSRDEMGAATGIDTAWYSLVSSGSPEATNHTWRISTRIRGGGIATADASLDGGSWGEAVLAIQFTGDHDNAATGQLVVEDSGGAQVSLAAPANLRITLEKTARMVGVDKFRTDRPRTTVGTGRCCRVRVDTAAEVKVSAKSFTGFACVSLDGLLRADLEMTGTCLVRGLRIEDRFRVTTAPAALWGATVTAPAGGFGRGEESPPDRSTDEERGGAPAPGDEQDATPADGPDRAPATGPDTAPADGPAEPPAGGSSAVPADGTDTVPADRPGTVPGGGQATVPVDGPGEPPAGGGTAVPADGTAATADGTDSVPVDGPDEPSAGDGGAAPAGDGVPTR